MLILLPMILAAQKSACELPSSGSVYLTKFYKENCVHCQNMSPHINEIEDMLMRHDTGIKFKQISCDECDCDALDIVAVPTLILNKGKEEISRLRGYSDYNGIAKFITDNLDVDMKVFSRASPEDGKVIVLYERDFYSGFEGPWLILFYSKRKDPIRTIVADVAKKYSGQLKVGEISENNAVNLTHRFNIQTFPAVIAIYNGILAGYSGKHTPASVFEFVDRLMAPSFKEINLEEFEQLVSKDAKSPKFVVFYSNLGLANSFYRKAAHEYKLRAQIFKSKDPALFQRASIYPKKADEEDAKDEERVILTVFKDNVFHRCPIPLSNPQGIAEWLFNSHFPNVTRITNDNFYTVFHGIKPAVLLLTQNDELVELLEDAANRINTGLPFNDQVMAVLDVNEFSMFLPALLPGLKSPVMVIFDPQRQLFFTRKVRFNSVDFYNDLLTLVNMYFEGKLKPYPYRSSWKKYMFGIIFLFILGFLVSLVSKRKNILKRE
ncbi:Thioredoxin/protein disulfide isomerase [Trachipleistophora hominis]|uniref:Thioredoxin/protein disulfide isomerase n=1 Tax=Trachipleistophora hominis TaxID=72359 RepID=L7JYK7_TRAHO|nr:Thioredoxin/protein disulfide isomerase [Trachipleistophora hominis]